MIKLSRSLKLEPIPKPPGTGRDTWYSPQLAAAHDQVDDAYYRGFKRGIHADKLRYVRLRKAYRREVSAAKKRATYSKLGRMADNCGNSSMNPVAGTPLRLF